MQAGPDFRSGPLQIYERMQNSFLNRGPEMKRSNEEGTMRASLLACLLVIPAFAAAGEEEVIGTWTLVSSTRNVFDSGQEFDTYGKHPKGFINYGPDGRMMALIVYDDRPKPESIEKTTDQQRTELFRSMLAYGGTYKFDGKSVAHNIDIS